MARRYRARTPSRAERARLASQNSLDEFSIATLP
jgi:hypothetical protein